MGPILGFRGCLGGQWKVCAILVADDNPNLDWSVAGQPAASVVPAPLALGPQTVLLYEWSVPQADADQIVTYTVAGAQNSFTVPGRTVPLRFAYASCNGFSSAALAKRTAHKNERWVDFQQQHAQQAYHLLLMGGDEVYADSIWEVVPQLKSWLDKSRDERRKAAFTATMDTKVQKFYFTLYTERWAQSEVAQMLASVPTIMMWDDHDIFDGWGSYPKEDHECPVYQGVFKHARDAFRVFQLKSGVANLPPATLPNQPAFTAGYVLGNVAVLAPDLRSERTLASILSTPTWNSMLNWLDGLNGVEHLLIMSSIPVVYPDFGAIESVLGWIPGLQELEDDLRDHWRTRTHRIERLRLIHRLLDFANAKNCRVTLLSGDVHVAALGYIQNSRTGEPSRNTNVINQLISSGIVHPAPPGMVLFYLKQIGDEVEDVDRGIAAQMAAFAGTDTKFIAARNWLSLKFDADKRLWAEWRTEGDPTPYSKVVHPCDPL